MTVLRTPEFFPVIAFFCFCFQLLFRASYKKNWQDQIIFPTYFFSIFSKTGLLFKIRWKLAVLQSAKVGYTEVVTTIIIFLLSDICVVFVRANQSTTCHSRTGYLILKSYTTMYYSKQFSIHQPIFLRLYFLHIGPFIF